MYILFIHLLFSLFLQFILSLLIFSWGYVYLCLAWIYLVSDVDFKIVEAVLVHLQLYFHHKGPVIFVEYFKVMWFVWQVGCLLDIYMYCVIPLILRQWWTLEQAFQYIFKFCWLWIYLFSFSNFYIFFLSFFYLFFKEGFPAGIFV